MNKETIATIVEEAFNLIEEKVKGRPLLLMVSHALEAILKSHLDTLLDRFLTRQKLS